MRRYALAAVPAVVAVTVATTVAPPAAASPPAAANASRWPPPAPVVAYRPPVDRPVVDTFRPPASPYGAGNRGVDYATEPGDAVGASGGGVVVFAGAVGPGRHVVVLHPDGIRTSYSFLDAVGVHRGQAVAAGDLLGTAGRRLHFGARAGDAYVDPLVLLAGGSPQRLRLVPDGDFPSEAGERRGLVRMLAALPRAGLEVAGSALSWARRAPAAATALVGADEILAWLRAGGISGGPSVFSVVHATSRWLEHRATCTPAGTVVPRLRGRRLAVLVAGLGSSSASAGVYRVRTADLGYAPRDVVRFSYRGGTTAERAYAPADTQGDIRVAGARLRALLEGLARRHPGVPIDVIAHSQGGLVSRAALGQRAPPQVEHLMTLGSPHGGADVATALRLIGATPRGAALQWLVARTGAFEIDPRSRSVRQMAEGSSFLRRLNAQPLPPGVKYTSVAAATDVVVASPRSHLEGATNVVVSVPALHAHDALPASAAATREMALALAGMAPACESLAEAIADAVVGDLIGGAEDLAGLAVARYAA